MSQSLLFAVAVAVLYHLHGASAPLNRVCMVAWLPEGLCVRATVFHHHLHNGGGDAVSESGWAHSAGRCRWSASAEDARPKGGPSACPSPLDSSPPAAAHRTMWGQSSGQFVVQAQQYAAAATKEALSPAFRLFADGASPSKPAAVLLFSEPVCVLVLPRAAPRPPRRPCAV